MKSIKAVTVCMALSACGLMVAGGCHHDNDNNSRDRSMSDSGGMSKHDMMMQGDDMMMRGQRMKDDAMRMDSGQMMNGMSKDNMMMRGDSMMHDGQMMKDKARRM